MHRVKNCGSFLQAYATQKAIEQIGKRAEIIDYMYPTIDSDRSYHYAPVSCRHALTGLLQNLIHRRWKLIKKQIVECRWCVMLHTNLTLSKKTYDTQKELMKVSSNYDVLVLGSDQVWNERFTQSDLSFFLPFAKPTVRTVSYASSMTNSVVSEEYSKMLKKHLKNFTFLSTREQSSAISLNSMLDRHVYSVLDPVMLFTPDEWLKCFHIKLLQKKNYILLFMLNYMGNVSQSAINYLHEYKNAHPNINIYSTIHLDIAYNIIDNVFPQEFVSLIANAEYVITDSFHASAFALLFNVPFTPIVHHSKNDIRIIDLCERVAIKSGDVYFTNVECLNVEREKSWDYLNKALV